MAYVFYNPNPAGKFTSDCVVRAPCADILMTVVNTIPILESIAESGLMTATLMKTETIVEEDQCTASKIALSMPWKE